MSESHWLLCLALCHRMPPASLPLGSTNQITLLPVPWPARHWGCMYPVDQSAKLITCYRLNTHLCIPSKAQIWCHFYFWLSSLALPRRGTLNLEAAQTLQAAARKLFGLFSRAAQELSSSNWCTSFPPRSQCCCGFPVITGLAQPMRTMNTCYHLQEKIGIWSCLSAEHLASRSPQANHSL